MEIIKNNISEDGINYCVRNIHYNHFYEIMGSLGNFIIESNSESHENSFFSYSFKMDNGAYIYRSRYDSDIALKIYKDYADYKYVFHDDEKLIKKLQRFQSSIKLTKFPSGIVSVEDKVIGQEIPFYNNSKTLLQVIEKEKNTLNPYFIYNSVFRIINELLDNNIIYSDIHPKNFLLVDDCKSFALIDFEPSFISFDGESSCLYNDLINNLKHLIICIDNLYGLNTIKKTDYFDNIKQIEKKLIIK